MCVIMSHLNPVYQNIKYIPVTLKQELQKMTVDEALSVCSRTAFKSSNV